MSSALPSMRGERFHIDVPEEADPVKDATPPVFTVGDVLERPTSTAAAPPSLPRPGGFPEHGHRTRTSRFRAQKSGGATSDASLATPAMQDGLKLPRIDSDLDSSNGPDALTADIDQENNARLAKMSVEEIEEEQAELRRSLDPALLRFLSRRSAQASAETSSPLSAEAVRDDLETDHKQTGSQNFGVDSKSEPETARDAPPEEAVSDQAAAESERVPAKSPQVNDQKLDENSESFLDDLHAKYFPSLPAEPEKLAWMRAAPDTSYSPDLDSVHLSNIRFDFRGLIISPRTAARISTARGLHHHADAPESAGYTIPELAHLSRSSVPMQRCIAYQTLGRILYRLGVGAYGPNDGKVYKALHRMMREGRILDTLQEEISRKPAHLSAKNYATEALWLWHRAGGPEFQAD